MIALLLFALLLAVLIGACVEFHWLRQTVRERSDRLTAELHTVEAVLAEHRGILDGLDNGLADLHKILETQSGDIQSLSVSQNSSALHFDTVFANSFAQVQKVHECLDRMEKFQIQYGGMLEKVSAVVCQPADTASDPDRDIQLSKAMEEGIMNLMQYAAGKTSGGVEVGLG